MATFTFEGTTFSVPDRPTVRQQLAYRSAISAARTDDVYERHWAGVKGLVQEWTSDVIDKPATFSLDDSDDPRATDVIFWACNAVAGHMGQLDAMEKK